MTTATTEAVPAYDEAEDIRLSVQGDGRAFERLYRRHVGRVHALMRRMVDAQEADDLTQEVFVRAWDKLGTFRGDAGFGTWLHRLAINLALSKRGAFARLRTRFPLMDALPPRPARSDRPGLRMDLEAAMERLPDGARHVFVLHDVEGYKHHEIAAMLGVTVGTSKSQLHRARMELRKHLVPA